MTNAARAGHGALGSRRQRRRTASASYFVPPTDYTQTLAAADRRPSGENPGDGRSKTRLVERNGPVPPQYKNLVEDYYRVLSQDLR